MILLDENIIESQRLLLRSWRIAARQIGRETGRAGMQDDELPTLFHTLPQPTFFTRDLRFFSRDEPHSNYCICALNVGQQEVAVFVRQTLRHPQFNTQRKRMGCLMLISQSGLRVRRLHRENIDVVTWPS